MVIQMLCIAALAATPPPMKKTNPKAPHALAVVKVGDFVDYDFTVTLQSRHPRDNRRTRLRAQAAVVDGTRIAVDVTVVDGPGTRWLTPGLRLWLDSKGVARQSFFHPEDNFGSKEGALVEETRGDQRFDCKRVAFDGSRGDGPRGTACVDSRDPRLALGGGLVELRSVSSDWNGGGGFEIQLVGAGNAAPGKPAPDAWPTGNRWVRWRGKGSGARNQREFTSMGSEGGRVVETTTRWEESVDDDRVDEKFAGINWHKVTTDVWPSPLPRHLLNLVGAGYIDAVPKSAKPGPPFTAGPVTVETLEYEEKGARLTVVANPEAALRLPLSLRYDVLKRATVAGPGEYDFEMVEWR